MAKREIKCHACGHVRHTIDIEDPRDWCGTTQDIRVSGSYFSSLDTGEVRTVTIGGKEYKFLRNEVRAHWPALERLIIREDEFPL
jgi:hypothetical protein